MESARQRSAAAAARAAARHLLAAAGRHGRQACCSPPAGWPTGPSTSRTGGPARAAAGRRIRRPPSAHRWRCSPTSSRAALSGVQAFLDGALTVRGNLALALQLDGLFPGDEADDTRTYTRSVRAGGLETFYLEAGPVDAPPVVLVHGLGATNASMLPLIPALSKDYRVLAPDLPGHGGTQATGAAARGALPRRLADRVPARDLRPSRRCWSATAWAAAPRSRPRSTRRTRCAGSCCCARRSRSASCASWCRSCASCRTRSPRCRCASRGGWRCAGCAACSPTRPGCPTPGTRPRSTSSSGC